MRGVAERTQYAWKGLIALIAVGGCLAVLPLWSSSAVDRAAPGKTRVACADGVTVNGQLTFHFPAAPKRCDMFRRGSTSSVEGAVYARSIKWNWGRKVATGKGKRGISTAGLFPATFRLTKPVERCGRTVFSKLAYVTKFDGEKSKEKFRLYTC